MRRPTITPLKPHHVPQILGMEQAFAHKQGKPAAAWAMEDIASKMGDPCESYVAISTEGTVQGYVLCETSTTVSPLSNWKPRLSKSWLPCWNM